MIEKIMQAKIAEGQYIYQPLKELELYNSMPFDPTYFGFKQTNVRRWELIKGDNMYFITQFANGHIKMRINYNHNSFEHVLLDYCPCDDNAKLKSILQIFGII